MNDNDPDILAIIDSIPDPTDSPEGRRIARELIRGWFTTVRAKDLQGLLALMSPDVVIELPFNESGRTEEGAFRRYRGLDEVRGFWEAAFRAEGKSHGQTSAELTMSADGRIAFLESRGNLTMSSGKSYRNRYVFRFVAENGRLVHVREYYNPITSAYAFGRPVAGKHMIEAL
jgi:ketosteroid isomerase-like protein